MRTLIFLFSGFRLKVRTRTASQLVNVAKDAIIWEL